MKELFTKRFWNDVKEIFDDARAEPPQTPAVPKSLQAGAHTQTALNIEPFQPPLQAEEGERLSQIAPLAAEAQASGETEVAHSTDAAASQATSQAPDEETIASRPSGVRPPGDSNP